MKDPFLTFQAELSNIWNEKKGLAFSSNKRQRERIFKRLKAFVESLPDWQEKLGEEIETLESFYNS